MRSSHYVRTRALLAVTITVLAGLVCLLLFLPGRPAPIRPPALEPSRPPDAADAVQVSTRLDITRTREGAPDFRLRAEQVVGRSGALYELLAPDLEIAHREGGSTRIRGERGRFDAESGEGTMQGGVAAEETGGLRLESESLRCEEGGERLESRGETHFARGGVSGTGLEVSYRRAAGRLILRRDVRLRGEPGGQADGWNLDSSQVDYWPASGELRAGPFHLRGRRGELAGATLAGQVRPDSSALDDLVADGSARLTVRTDAGDTALLLIGERIQLDVGPGGLSQPRQVRASGSAELLPGLPEAGFRRLGAQEIILRPAEADLREVTAIGSVELDQGDQPSARLEAARLQALLDARGVLRDGLAAGEVRFHGPDGEAGGDQAEVAGGGRQILLTGSPGDPPWLQDADRRITARRLLLDRAARAVRAEGEVRTLSTGRPGDPLFRSGEALHGTAERFDGRLDGESGEYRGGVRLWQGERLLQADRVAIRRDEPRLEAWGRVRTRAPSEAGPAGGLLDGEAAHFEFREADSTARYEGEARVRFGADEVDADRVMVVLGPEREVLQVDAQGEVRLTGPGRQGIGDILQYRPVEGWARLLGGARPAEAQDTIYQRFARGHALTWRLADATIEVESPPGGRSWITLPPPPAPPGDDPEAAGDGAASGEGSRSLETQPGH